MSVPVFDLPAPPKADGTLWTPRTVELKTASHGLVQVNREVYAGAAFPTDGKKVASFTKTFLKASKGFHAREPLRLRRHQREVIDGIFRTDPFTGERVVRTAIVQAPRKWGKSQVAVPIALWFLLMEFSDGAPEVIGAATDRNQAKLVFNEARQAVLQSEHLSEYVKVYKDALEVIKGPNLGGVYKVISSDSGSAMGLNPSCVIADEVATWYGTELWYALTLAQAARRNPLVVAISTPGWNQNSHYHTLCQLGARILTGEVVDPTFYYRAFTPSVIDADWLSFLTWMEANPGIGDYLSTAFYESAILQATEAEFRIFNLGQWVSGGSTWIRSEEWETCNAGEDGHIAHGERVTVVFDGSLKNDSTAIVVATPDGRVGIARLEDGTPCIWEKPPASNADWKVPVLEVEEAIRKVCALYTTEYVAFDPYQWVRTMEVLQEEGLPIVEFPMGSVARMVPAANRFEVAVRTKALRHDGDPTLARHVGNMVVKTDYRGSRPTKSALSKKIDAGICAVVAYHLATQVVEAPVIPDVPTVQNIWG